MITKSSSREASVCQNDIFRSTADTSLFSNNKP